MSKERVAFLEVDQEFCSRVYSQAPCTAALGVTGTRKCYQTQKTCQDPANYDGSTQPYLSLPGTSGNYASTPDSVANSIVGDITLVALLAPNDWTPGAIFAAVAKWTETGNQRAYKLEVLTDGKLRLSWSNDGTAVLSADSTAGVGATDGRKKYIKATLDVNDGAANRVIKFWTSDDGLTWTQLGSTVTTAGVTSIFNSTAILTIGATNTGTAALWAGKVYYAEIRSGIDGPLKARFAPSQNTTVLGLTSFVSDAGETWTINQSGSPAATLAMNALTLRCAQPQEGLLQYGNLLPSMQSIETTPSSINLAAMDRGAAALGKREVVSARFTDHQHSDHLVDKYRLERATGQAVASDGEVHFEFIDGSIIAQHGSELASITFTRAGATATRVNALGLIETVAADTPRFDFDPVTLACKGLLIEEARTNLLTRSAEFDHANWGKDGGITVTANQALAPDGTLSMDKMTRGAGTLGNWAQLTQAVSASPFGKTYSFSVWVASLSGSKNFFLSISDANFVSKHSGLMTATTTPQRFKWEGQTGWDAAATVIGGGINILDATGDLLVWGADLEEGAFCTSYIPTTSAAVTRNADDPLIASLGSWFNAAEGAVFAEILPGTLAPSWATIVSVNDATVDERIDFGVEQSRSKVGLYVVDGGVTQVNSLGFVQAPVVGSVYRSAFCYRVNDFAASNQGAAAETDSVGTLPTVTRMQLGNDTFGRRLNGHLRRFTYYPRRLSNTDLQALSGSTHHPAAIVPFANPYNPHERGTFWGKWLARNPYYTAFPARVRDGLIGDALSVMDLRQYVIDRIEGPDNGTLTLIAKDLFSKIEARKSVAPKASNGRLLSAITNVATSATLTPSGIGNLEYPASGHVAIGKEEMSFTRSGDVLTITRATSNTTAEAHDADDLVQLVLVYTSKLAHDIVHDLLLKYTALEDAQLPKAQWDVAMSAVTELYSAHIAQSTPVLDLVGELAEQAGFTIWPDVRSGQIKMAPLRATAASLTIDDGRDMIGDAVSVKPLVSRRASQVWVWYGQRNPLEGIDDRKNYASRTVSADPAAEDLYGTPAIREVFSRWISQFGRTFALKTGGRIREMFRDPPFEAQFRLHADKLSQLGLAQFVSLLIDEVQDDVGLRKPTTHALVEIERDDDELGIRTMQVSLTPETPNAERVIFIDNDANDLNLRTIHDQIYSAPTGTEIVRFKIAAGKTVGSTSTATRALRTGSWPTGVTLYLDNAGRIQGKGGAGGLGGGGNASAGTLTNGAVGNVGGDALHAEYAITVDNLGGEIWAGGGGGGGGASGGNTTSGQFTRMCGGGGGGGAAGTNGGVGGGPGTNFNISDPSEAGFTGSDAAGGNGGDGGNEPAALHFGGDGGVGGNPGLAGSSGAAATGLPRVSSPGAGGQPGKYAVGNSNITWVNVGDRRGGVA